MTDAEVQKKLDQLARIANELDNEAKRRYGSEGQLFFEAEGQFHFMSSDHSDAGISERQSGIVMTSKGNTRMGCGAW